MAEGAQAVCEREFVIPTLAFGHPSGGGESPLERGAEPREAGCVQSLREGMKKYFQIAEIIWTETALLRTRALIWTLIDVTWMFVMPLLWLSTEMKDALYSNGQFVLYYFMSGLIGMLTIAYVHYDLRNDIHSGLFTNALLKPMNQLGYRFAEHVSYKSYRLFLILPFLILYWLVFHPDISLLRGSQLLFIVAVALGSLLTFLMSYTIGLLGLFVEDSEAINTVYNLSYSFLAGEVAPLTLFPHLMQSIATHLPFYFTLGFPIDVMLGKGVIDPARGIVWQMVWIVATFLISRLVWKRGIMRWQGQGR